MIPGNAIPVNQRRTKIEPYSSGGGGNFIIPTSFSYTVSGFTPTRTLNAGTATLADVANTLATLINDLKTSKIIQ